MAQSIREVMTTDPLTVDAGATLVEAAEAMAKQDIGPVLVAKGGRLCGILTDRDIVVRAIAEGREPSKTTAGEICTESVVTLTPDQSAEEAVDLMREHDVRRLPVLDGDRPAGIVSIGDLAVKRDERSALADISSAAPNN